MFRLAPLPVAARVIGLRAALLLRLSHYSGACLRRLRIRYPQPLFSLHIKGYEHPVTIRLASTDILVLDQIFIQMEYSPFDDIVPAPRWMIDCGANVGFASLYFLNVYPHLQVIVLEPDADNLELCRKNLAPYRDRVHIIHKGLWNRPANLVLSGTGWSTKAREAESHERADIEATDVPALLALIPHGEADLLKVDIERSERIVFADPHTPWLSRIRNIAIELHDDQCESVFFRALEPFQYELSQYGDLTFCGNVRPRA